MLLIITLHENKSIPRIASVAFKSWLFLAHSKKAYNTIPLSSRRIAGARPDTTEWLQGLVYGSAGVKEIIVAFAPSWQHIPQCFSHWNKRLCRWERQIKYQPTKSARLVPWHY